MKAKLIFVDGAEQEFTGLVTYETTNFFLKFTYNDNHEYSNREHNIALGFIRELIWEKEDE